VTLIIIQFNPLGRVLGKALFENITIQPQFAHFFLAFMHGRYNFMNLVNDLRTLDEGLYKNLMFLKPYSVSLVLESLVGVVCRVLCVGW
jgi:ubiquitin-protein ligase E3 C